MNSRTAMLADIRWNLEKSAQFEHLYHHLQPSRSSPLPFVAEISRQDLAGRFASELTAIGGEVRRAENNETGLELIKVILNDIGAKNVAVSDLGLMRDSRLDKVELIRDATRDQLFAVDAGISTAQFAIAETGTLVLRSSMESHRLVSLVPPVHLCVLKTADIRLSMSEVLGELSKDIDPTITFITGPSRTSDIELTLAIGVHGPKRLIVVLID